MSDGWPLLHDTVDNPPLSGREIAAAKVQAELNNLNATDLTPPLGGWYNTAINTIAGQLETNPYDLDQDVRDLVRRGDDA